MILDDVHTGSVVHIQGEFEDIVYMVTDEYYGEHNEMLKLVELNSGAIVRRNVDEKVDYCNYKISIEYTPAITKTIVLEQ